MCNIVEKSKFRKGQIYASKNSLPHREQTYFVSMRGSYDASGKSQNDPWNLERFYKEMENIPALSNVLFERGNIFRLNKGINLVSQVSYGAYGTGSKPVLCGSLKNYADEKWNFVSEGIWSVDLHRENAGILVSDGGEKMGLRRLSLDELEYDLDFYHDIEKGILYLYSPEKSPEGFNSIEIGVCINLFNMYKKNTIAIDNLNFQLTGRHGIASAFCENITVTNCEFGWIGGSSDGNGVTRLGNAVEFYGSGKNLLVENCFIDQIFDAGLTFQVTGIGEFSDITFRNNLIENCAYSIEFFNVDMKHHTGFYKNILIEDNLLMYAGYGLATRAGHREWWVAVSHINGWKDGVEPTENFVIRNNTLYCSITNLVYWKHYYNQTQNVSVYGNSFYQTGTPDFARDVSKYHALTVDTSIDFGAIEHPHSTECLRVAKDQRTFAEAVSFFDPSPKEVLWLD